MDTLDVSFRDLFKLEPYVSEEKQRRHAGRA